MIKMLALLTSLKDNEGITLKNGKIVKYKTGWQVATEGVETKFILAAAREMEKMNGTCGVWYANGIYYIDKSYRVKTKKEALRIGKKHNQISIYGWARGNLAYC